MLTALRAQAAKARVKPYGLADGHGLFLWVNPDETKFWHFRFRFDGKQPRISLGIYPDVSLREAREAAAEARALVRRGVDPRQHRKKEKKKQTEQQTNLFKAAAELWYESKVKAGRSQSTLGKMRTYLDKDILPVLGEKYLPSVTRADCASVQARIEKRNAHNVAKKVRGWLREIFRQSIARGSCEHNVASELGVIAAPAPESKPYPHLLEPELPDFLKALDRSTSRIFSRTAAWMTIWTASRPGMVRFAEWEEIDLDDALWTISAAKMKMKRPHVTPLPSQLVAALRELKRRTGHHRYLFPGIGTKNETISEKLDQFSVPEDWL